MAKQIRHQKRKPLNPSGPVQVRRHRRSPRGPNKGKPRVTVRRYRRGKPAS